MTREDQPFDAGDRKVANFKDFIQKLPNEKAELEKTRRSFKKNDASVGQKERKLKFNKVTRKLDDVGREDIEDALDKLEENSTYDSQITREQIEKRSMELYPEHFITTRGSKYDANGPRRVSYTKCWSDIQDGFFDS